MPPPFNPNAPWNPTHPSERARFDNLNASLNAPFKPNKPNKPVFDLGFDLADVGEAASTILPFINTATAIDSNAQASQANQQNYNQQSALLAWQKAAQQTTWDREDNAVQRRADDLRLAGMSPHLAAGGAAVSSGPISMRAPQKDPSIHFKQ